MSQIPFRPLNKRILVRRLEAAEKSKGGLVLPTSSKEKPLQAQVMVVENSNSCVEPGFIVLFGKYAGEEIEIDGTEYLLLKEEELLGITGFKAIGE